MLFGSLAGIALQAACFVLYLALTSLWKDFAKKKRTGILFSAGFALAVLSQLVELGTATAGYNLAFAPALSVWDCGYVTRLAFDYWKEGIDLMSILNIASILLYLAAFMSLKKSGLAAHEMLCTNMAFFLLVLLVLAISPFSSGYSLLHMFAMGVAFVAQCRFFFLLHKIVL